MDEWEEYWNQYIGSEYFGDYGPAVDPAIVEMQPYAGDIFDDFFYSINPVYDWNLGSPEGYIPDYTAMSGSWIDELFSAPSDFLSDLASNDAAGDMAALPGLINENTGFQADKSWLDKIFDFAKGIQWSGGSGSGFPTGSGSSTQQTSTKNPLQPLLDMMGKLSGTQNNSTNTIFLVVIVVLVIVFFKMKK